MLGGRGDDPARPHSPAGPVTEPYRSPRRLRRPLLGRIAGRLDAATVLSLGVTNDRPSVGAPRAGAAGALAAAVALGTGEFVGGLLGALTARTVSPVGAIGDWFIDSAGRPLARPAIASLGSAAKPALVVGTVIVALAIGVVTGIATRQRPQVAAVVFGGAGIAGAAALVGVAKAGLVVATLTALAAAAAGWWSLRLLLRVAGGQRALPITTSPYPTAPTAMAGTTMNGGVTDRRRFLAWSALAGTVAGVGALAGSRLGGSAAETARRTIQLPVAATTPSAARVGAPATMLEVNGLAPVITPNADFYRIDTALVIPDVDPSDWALEITGLVERPLRLSYDDLLALPMVEDVVTLACVSNPVGGSLVGTAVWQGVPLADVLNAAGVQPGATQLVGRSVDGFTVGFPTEAAFDGRTALVAVGMNGEPLPVRHGFPARLVVSGLYGYVSATKWLRQIELTTWDAFDAYWVPRGWSKEGPVRTQSRIDVPTGQSPLRAGTLPVAGVAWAPGIGIARVEVQVDEGPWVDATLSESLSDDAWRQWVVEWDADPGFHVVRARATDRSGFTQPSAVLPVAPSGAQGWHTRRVTVQDA
jgi:DMSO/TMAO reductase YedYZ molybdopterin-dependent catalytic subunit